MQEGEQEIILNDSEETRGILHNIVELLNEMDIQKRKRNKLDKLLIELKQSISSDMFKCGFSLGFNAGSDINELEDESDEELEELPDLKA